MIELLGPEQSRERLTHDVTLVARQRAVRFVFALELADVLAVVAISAAVALVSAMYGIFNQVDV